MSKKMVALIGEQPVPNLLPIRHDQPSDVLLVWTTRTKQVAERLANLLKRDAAVFECEVDPYDITAIYQELHQKITTLGWPPAELVFNLTGGTKTMAFAAYQLALDKVGCQFLYLESEGGKSRLRQYGFENSLATLERDEIIPAAIKLADYLGA